MTFERAAIGKKGENLALLYLKKQGYKIIGKNYKTKVGEIDIIGNDKDVVSFIEVRSINSATSVSPEHTINKRKQNQIAKTALSYIKSNGLEDKDCRFDVVCVEDVGSCSPNIRLIKDAFELASRYRY
ncbi:MAG: YraN family protein [Candidatus Omnitrophica bacterium]|nr:YraN family protein [Candidatus Omnitrophota bacterium]